MKSRNTKLTSKNTGGERKTKSTASSGARKKIKLVVKINKRKKKLVKKDDQENIKQNKINTKIIGQNKKNKLESKQNEKNKIFILKKKKKIKGEEFLKKIIKEKKLKSKPKVIKHTEKIKITKKLKDIIDKSTNKEKQIIMWIGVSFFMILIILIWGYNIKKIFYKNNINKNKVLSEKSLPDISNDFSKNITEMKNNLKKIKSFIASSSSANIIATSTIASSTSANLPISKNNFFSATNTNEKLKNN